MLPLRLQWLSVRQHGVPAERGAVACWPRYRPSCPERVRAAAAAEDTGCSTAHRAQLLPLRIRLRSPLQMEYGTCRRSGFRVHTSRNNPRMGSYRCECEPKGHVNNLDVLCTGWKFSSQLACTAYRSTELIDMPCWLQPRADHYVSTP